MPTAVENTLVDSALALGSGIPKLNPIKLNENIQNSSKANKVHFHNKLQSPLTAFNNREKKFKKDLTGTYGKNYKADESKDNFTERLEELKERKEEKEQMKDLNLSNASAIPNSYLYQPDSESRNWMLKRGKDKQAYLKNDQMKRIREYFMELDIDKSGMISPQEIEETLISFGLCKTKEEVESIMGELDTDGFGELDFEKFLHLLKEASLQNGKHNYLVDRNVLGEKNTRAKSRDHTLKLPSLTHKASERSIDFN